jgi:hypothetical protein
MFIDHYGSGRPWLCSKTTEGKPEKLLKNFVSSRRISSADWTEALRICHILEGAGAK